MIIAHYAHRLPADYDLGIIRKRAKERGPLWDALPELHFKGFLLRERGRLGAIANDYSSLYLWRKDEAFRDFLISDRFKAVTDSFGRPAIETRFALDARKGAGHLARFATRQERAIPRDADLTAEFAAEIVRNRETAEQSGTVAAAVGVDARTSAARSQSGVSCSWPTAETTGVGHPATARTTRSSLNGRRSSKLPPPRASTITSISGAAQTASSASTIAAAARGPCTYVSATRTQAGGKRVAIAVSTSRFAAASFPVTSPIRRGKRGSGRLRAASKSPSAASFLFSRSRAAR